LIHLDTSFMIRALDPDTEEDQKLRMWLRRYEPLATSTVAWTEFLCGPIDAAQVDRVARLVPLRVPLEDDDARLAARLFNASGRRRGSMNDCMIAASAIRMNAKLATVNSTDFQRFVDSGLELA
jgi:predicted nucleic acid-binding protein